MELRKSNEEVNQHVQYGNEELKLVKYQRRKTDIHQLYHFAGYSKFYTKSMQQYSIVNEAEYSASFTILLHAVNQKQHRLPSQSSRQHSFSVHFLGDTASSLDLRSI